MSKLTIKSTNNHDINIMINDKAVLATDLVLRAGVGEFTTVNITLIIDELDIDMNNIDEVVIDE